MPLLRVLTLQIQSERRTVEHRLYSAPVGVTLLVLVGVLTLFPQFMPHGIQIHCGKGDYATPGRFPVPNRGAATRSTSWSSAEPAKAQAAFDRGTLNLEREEWELALREFNSVLHLQPKNSAALYQRAIAKCGLQQYDSAVADLDAAIRLRPQDADALLARAAVRIEQGLPKLAISDLDAALGIDPQNIEAYCERGKIREEAGEYRLALYDYQLAFKQASDDPMVLNHLAWLLSTAPNPTARDGQRAVEMAARAVKLENAQEWDTIDTLAAAFAEVGKFPEAVRAQQEALRLAPEEEHADLKSRLELYQAKKPYRLGGE